MGYFPATVAAALASRTVAVSLLCAMDFRDTPRNWWLGFGPLQAGGIAWQGTGEMIAIDGLEQPIGTVAPKTSFKLSGIDSTLVSLARQASNRVKDRRCTVYVQFFDITPGDASIEPWSPLDDPFAVWSGTMDRMTYDANGPALREITLTAESFWTNRRRPAYGLFTDRDQNARYPGDRGLEQVSSLASKQSRWPVV